MLSFSSGGVTLLKYLLAVSLGITFRSFYDLPPAKMDIPEMKPCVCPTHTGSRDHIYDLNANLQLRESFSPHSKHEVISYDFFNSSIAIGSSSCSQITGVTRIDKIDIAEVVTQTAALISSQKKNDWKVTNLENGYRRNHPARGIEYVIDVTLESPDKTAEKHRIQLIRPFGFMRILSDNSIDGEKMIHFVVAVAKASSEFHRFLVSFEDVFLQDQHHSYLMIVACVNSTSEIERVRAAATTLQRQHWRRLHVRVVQLKRAFSPALALDIGLRQLPSSALVMILDIHTQFSNSVLDRCRLGALEGKQIYSPIPFVHFVPNIVKQFSPEHEVHESDGLNKHTGEWAVDDYSVLCIYAGDYRAVGGYNISNENWQLDLFERQVATNIQIFRSVDPGLIRPFASETCTPSNAKSHAWPKLCVGDRFAARHHLIKMLQNCTMTPY